MCFGISDTAASSIVLPSKNLPWGTGTGLGAQGEATEARLYVVSISKQPVNTGELGFVNFLDADSMAQHEHISVWTNWFKASFSIDGDIENPNLGCIQYLNFFTNGKWTRVIVIKGLNSVVKRNFLVSFLIGEVFSVPLRFFWRGILSVRNRLLRLRMQHTVNGVLAQFPILKGIVFIIVFI